MSQGKWEKIIRDEIDIREGFNLYPICIIHLSCRYKKLFNS